jgi:ceramide glucosyltransferase
MILFWSSIAASLTAVIGCGYLIAAAALVGRFSRAAASPSSGRVLRTPSVTILKPLHGTEPGLIDNLASFCVQDYAGPVQIVFGVQDSNDAAVAVVERLRSVQNGRDIDLVVDSKVHGSNRKVCNLVNMAARIRHEVVVIADSDMRVDADYLSRVVAVLEAPGVDAVTCLYVGVAATGIWARLSVLAINAHFLPSVVVGMALGRARPSFGSTLAMRRATLDAIGGFAPFVERLADDYAIGEALRALGCRIVIPPFALAHMCTPITAGELWRQELRWGRTIRSIDPAGYTGSIVAHPLPPALVAIVLGVGSTALVPALCVALAAIVCRMALLRQVERTYDLPPQPYWLVPARDLLSFALFVWSFLGRDVSWKGRRYRAGAGR